MLRRIVERGAKAGGMVVGADAGRRVFGRNGHRYAAGQDAAAEDWKAVAKTLAGSQAILRGAKPFG